MTTSSVNNSLFSILQQSYVKAGQNVSATPKGKYVPVDAKSYEGTWTGQYGDAKKIRMAITNVSGYKANVRYQSGSTVVQQQVLIRDNSFHIGESKFVLSSSGSGMGTLTTAVTDARTGNVSLEQARLTQLGSAADKSTTGSTSSSSSSAPDLSSLLGKFA